MRSLALLRFLPYLRTQRHLIAVTVISAVVALAAVTAIPLVVKAIIDGPIAHHRPQDLLPWAAVLLALACVGVAAQFGRRNYAVLASLRMETDLRNDFYFHLQSLPVAFHDSWQSGQLLSRAVADIQTVRRFIGFGLVFAGYFGLLWIAVLLTLLKLDWQLALLASAGALPIAFVSRAFFREYSTVARQVQDQQGDLTTVIEEAATGVRIIKAFGRDQTLRGRFAQEARHLREINLGAVRVRARTSSLFSLLSSLNLGLVLLVGGLTVMQGRLTIGGLVAFMTYLFMLIWPLDALGWILAMGEEAATAADRLAEVLDERPTVADRPGARPLQRVRGRIRFEDVWFQYPAAVPNTRAGAVRTAADHSSPEDDRRWVLRGFTLEIEPGETVALVGATGCGKTTAALLVPRLYDVNRGRVTFDGVDVRELSLRSLRSAIGTAFEEPILFSASVHENLVMGRSVRSDEELRKALEVARAEFVWELPWGLETRVGEQGYSLSGGQRQRLALARAVLGRPHVFVLDDPLSAVDVHTEAEIESALAAVLRGATGLIAVHRPSTLALADRVALVEGGRVVATGRHSDLMREQPLYRELLAQAAEEVA